MARGDLKRISRFLSLVLRHDPGRIGITLGPDGWTPVAELLRALDRHGRPLSRADLDWVIENNDKRRFALSDDGTMIRASQGHSVAVDLGYAPEVPPEHLYHGTVGRFLDAILADGLKRRARHDVHLSPDPGTATRVGARRGKPVILEIAAGAMHRDGHVFRLSANGVWLTDHVPPRYIRVLGNPGGAGDR